MIKRLMSALSLIGLLLLATPQIASAGTPLFTGVDCGSAGSSAVCQRSNKNPLFGKDSLIIKITNIIAFIAGAAAVIVIIIGALKFVTAGSDVSTGSRTDTDVEDARRSISNAVVGLIVIVLGKFLITYVVGKL